MRERGRTEGWTPGPERRRRFEGQHQTLHQLINACGVTPTQRGTAKTHQNGSPGAPAVTPSHRKAGNSTQRSRVPAAALFTTSGGDAQRMASWGIRRREPAALVPARPASPTGKAKMKKLGWYLSHSAGQISILFSNFACCTRRLAPDEKRHASNRLTRESVCLTAARHAVLKQRGLFLISTQRDLF